MYDPVRRGASPATVSAECVHRGRECECVTTSRIYPHSCSPLSQPVENVSCTAQPGSQKKVGQLMQSDGCGFP